MVDVDPRDGRAGGGGHEHPKAAAFAGPLAGRLQPLGVCGFEAAPQRFSSELYGWDAG